MSILQHRLRLQRLLFMVKHGQVVSAAAAAQLFQCHPSTIKRLIAQLRLEGHVITYDQQLKRYVWQEEE